MVLKMSMILTVSLKLDNEDGKKGEDEDEEYIPALSLAKGV
jgi:hypothetical protein